MTEIPETTDELAAEARVIMQYMVTKDGPNLTAEARRKMTRAYEIARHYICCHEQAKERLEAKE